MKLKKNVKNRIKPESTRLTLKTSDLDHKIEITSLKVDLNKL